MLLIGCLLTIHGQSYNCGVLLVMGNNIKQIMQNNKSASPYLPESHGLLKEKLIRLKSRFTYWTWKRKIKKYINVKSEREQPIQFLDIGCGPGNFICCLESWFPNSKIRAIDYDHNLIKYADNRTNRTQLSTGSAEELPENDSIFDVLSCFHVIEHLNTPEKFFIEANRVLKKNGLLLLATPNTEGVAARMLGEKWNGIRKDHISLKTPKLWRDALKQNGFVILDEGTTLFNGLPLIGSLPLALPFQFLQSVFGWFPWKHGASYMVIAKKEVAV